MDFNSIQDILAHYDLSYQIAEFIQFAHIQPVVLADWFEGEIKFALFNRGEDDKEAFTAEFIIVPFLKEAWKRHPKLSLFSHVQLKDGETTLIPDYLISAKNPKGYKAIYKPLLLTVEAKNEDFDQGWRQALLQSLICQKINAQPDIPILSIVTTGDSWQFGKLVDKQFIRHPISTSLQDFSGLLGVLDEIFALCEKQL